MVSGTARERSSQVATRARTGASGQARLEAARAVDGARLLIRAGREHSVVGRHGHHVGRAGYRAERRTAAQTGSTEHERRARCGARRGRCPGSGGPAQDHRCAPRDLLAPPREWPARVRAAASPRDSRYVPALGASPWTDDGVPAPAWIEGAFSVWADY